MDMKYSFKMDTEPSDVQLKTLMQDVVVDVVKRKKEADKTFRLLLKEEVKRARERNMSIVNECLKNNGK